MRGTSAKNIKNIWIWKREMEEGFNDVDRSVANNDIVNRTEFFLCQNLISTLWGLAGTYHTSH